MSNSGRTRVFKWRGFRGVDPGIFMQKWAEPEGLGDGSPAVGSRGSVGGLRDEVSQKL